MDKGHTKLSFDDGAESEYQDFYDFRSTWAHLEEEHSGDDQDDEDMDMTMEEEESVELVGGSGRHAASAATTNDDLELVLPNGTRLGHRSLHRYYKQHLRSGGSSSGVGVGGSDVAGEQHRESFLIVRQRLAQQYRAHGLYGGSAVSHSRHHGFMTTAATATATTKKQHADDRQRHTRHAVLALRVGQKNNNQQHYRPQVDF